MTAVCLEKLVDLGPLEGDSRKVGVDRIYQNNHLNRSLRAAERGEAGDCLRGFVVENGEVLLLQVGDGCARLWRHDNIEDHAAGGGRGRRRRLLSRDGSRAQREDETREAEIRAKVHDSSWSGGGQSWARQLCLDHERL